MEEPAAYGKVGNFYLGALGGYSWADFGQAGEDDSFVGGLYGEWRFKREDSALGWGIEVDVMRTNLGVLVDKGRKEPLTIDQDWLASVRGKMGLQITPILYGYGTAGWAWSDLDDGIVFGGGLEANLMSNWVGRVEILRYDLTDQQTVIRGGLGWRF